MSKVRLKLCIFIFRYKFFNNWVEKCYLLFVLVFSINFYRNLIYLVNICIYYDIFEGEKIINEELWIYRI